MRVTLAQTSPKLNRSNLNDIIEIVKQNKDASDLIVFSELALSGYLLQDKLCEDAWREEELKELAVLSHEVDIAVGAAMRDGELFRNCGLYFSGGALVAKHIKVHLPNYGMFEEARYFEGGEKFEAFEVSGKKVSILVCEDLWHKEVHHELMRLNPDLIVVHVASPARGFSEDGLAIEQKWYAIIQKVAKECNAKLIFVNRVGFEDGLGFWGGSCVVNGNGEIIKQLPKFKKTIETIEI
ncbi:Glutamine amidotransferase chain of NAD synthetase [hydrothermal vent metagenome]|uniref:Glutamine amidotransferase chain of NAD synthetase n=1 Tax=hydrothermal vent metagenome TaxID=652676 RepID=A0A1W1CX58_9ZZZZ